MTKKALGVERYGEGHLHFADWHLFSLSFDFALRAKAVSSTMLSSLWGGSASSSKYTPLSDLEGSTVPPKHGTSPRLLMRGFPVSCLLGRTVCATAKIALFLFPLDAHISPRAMRLSNYLWLFGLVEVTGYLPSNHDSSLDFSFVVEPLTQFYTFLHSYKLIAKFDARTVDRVCPSRGRSCGLWNSISCRCQARHILFENFTTSIFALETDRRTISFSAMIKVS